MSLAERILDRQRALVIESKDGDLAITTGSLGMAETDTLSTIVTPLGFDLICNGSSVVKIDDVSPAVHDLLRSKDQVTVFQMNPSGEVTEFQNVPLTLQA